MVTLCRNGVGKMASVCKIRIDAVESGATLMENIKAGTGNRSGSKAFIDAARGYLRLRDKVAQLQEELASLSGQYYDLRERVKTFQEAQSAIQEIR